MVIGFGTTGISITSVPTIAIAYTVDCYSSVAGDSIVVATVIKNTCGISMSYWLPGMVAKAGITKPATTQFALFIGPCMIGIIFYLFGKMLRRRSRKSVWHEWTSEKSSSWTAETGRVWVSSAF